jgi:CheY-like chemotaxis protein
MGPSASGRQWVLLIDDHEDGRELMGEFLSFNGYDVQACGSGEEALKVVDELGAPRVVITDLSLGMMSGTDVARHLRDQEATHSVPILAVTGHAGFEDGDHLFNQVLVKPVILPELAAALRRVIAG